MKGKKKEEYPWNTDPHNSRCLQTGEGPKKGHEIIKALKNFPYDGRLKESGLSFMENRKISQDLITVF